MMTAVLSIPYIDCSKEDYRGSHRMELRWVGRSKIIWHLGREPEEMPDDVQMVFEADSSNQAHTRLWLTDHRARGPC